MKPCRRGAGVASRDWPDGAQTGAQQRALNRRGTGRACRRARVLVVLTPGHFRPPMGSGRGCGCRISGPQAAVYLVSALWGSHGSPQAFGTLDRMGAAHVGVAREHAKYTMVSLQCLQHSMARDICPARLQGVGEVRLLPWKRSRQSADEGWVRLPMRTQARTSDLHATEQ
jgi:hypothetical protein